MKRLIILDYFLIENSGHFERYDFSIAKEALQQGIQTEIWCPVRPEGEQPEYVKQCLRPALCRSRKLNGKVKAAFQRILQLRDIFARKLMDQGTLVLIQQVDSYYLPCLVAATVGIYIKPSIVIVVRRFSQTDAGVPRSWKQKLISFVNTICMKYLHRNKRVYFLSDSELVVERLRSEGFQNVQLLPVPHLPERCYKRPGCSIKRVAYLGVARLEKG